MNMRRLGTTLAAVAAVVTLAGCGGGNVPSAGHPLTHVKTTQANGAAATSGPAALPTAGLSTATVDANGNVNYCVDQKPFSGPVVDAWGGSANVMQAYCEMVKFTLENSWVGSLVKPPAPGKTRDVVEFSFVKQYMTSDLQDKWDAVVKKALAGDKASEDTVNLLTMYDDGKDETVTVQNRPDYVTNLAAGPATLDSDKRGPSGNPDRLVIKFTASADLHVLIGGKRNVVTVTKNISYALIPTGQKDIPWVIDDFTGQFSNSAAQPEQ